MPGAVSYGFHEGSRSEILAQYVFGSWGTAVVIPHQEDHGIDLTCTLMERVGNRYLARSPYTVQVKSTMDPVVFEGKEAVRWVIEHPLPLYLCVVDKSSCRVSVYHTLPRFYAWALGLWPDHLEMVPEPVVPGQNGKHTQWKAQEREAKEQERFERDTVAYRAASAEYDAARKLRLVRNLAKDALEEKARGNFAGAEKLQGKAEARYQEIVRDFPGTQGAADAQALLDGKEVAERTLLPLPVPPAPPALASDEEPAAGPTKPPNLVWLLVQTEQSAFTQNGAAQVRTASGELKTVTVYGRRSSNRAPDLVWLRLTEDDAHALADAPVNTSATADPPVSSPRTVYYGPAAPKTVEVHGYYRKNGTYVDSYTRSAPGSGGRR